MLVPYRPATSKSSASDIQCAYIDMYAMIKVNMQENKNAISVKKQKLYKQFSPLNQEISSSFFFMISTYLRSM